jgi:hypothetical protein
LFRKDVRPAASCIKCFCAANRRIGWPAPPPGVDLPPQESLFVYDLKTTEASGEYTSRVDHLLGMA